MSDPDLRVSPASIPSPRAKRGLALRHLALAAQGMTGADIERLVRDARGIARRAKRKLRYADIIAQLNRDAGTLPADLRWRVSVHEAGHALAFHITGAAELISLTTGRGSGGATAVRWPATPSQTEAGAMDIIACYLAGRAAEIMMFGTALIGNGGGEMSDLAIATTNAVRLETVFGCSADAPLLYMPSDRPSHDLRFDRDLADRVNKRLESALAMATNTVTQHREQLLALASVLDRRRFLDGEEARRLLGAVAGS
jgi:ATP-dependent Zn proteases